MNILLTVGRYACTNVSFDQVNNSILGLKADQKTLALHSLAASLITSGIGISGALTLFSDYRPVQKLATLAIAEIAAKHLITQTTKKSITYQQIGTLVPIKILEAVALFLLFKKV